MDSNGAKGCAMALIIAALVAPGATVGGIACLISGAGLAQWVQTTVVLTAGWIAVLYVSARMKGGD